MPPIPTQQVLNAIFAVLALIMLSHIWRGHDDPPPATTNREQTEPRLALAPNAPVVASSSEQDLEALATRLRSEQEARRRLEKQVAELSVQIQQLAQGSAPASKNAAARTETTVAASGGGTASTGEEATTSVDNGNSSWIDEQVLLDAGINVSQAKTIKKQFEKMEMDRLYLRDQATREGWIGTARYVEEVEKLNERVEDIRDEVGESNYGAYLYATGQPNQVVAESVLDSSPAQQAGVQAGDVIVSYDGKLIYTWSDVRAATASGEAGQPVRLVLSRNGENIDTYIVRGPLGVRLAVRRQKP